MIKEPSRRILWIGVMPTLGAWGYFQELIKFFYMHITTFPPSKSIVKHRRARVIIASFLVVILLSKRVATTFAFTYLFGIYIEHLGWHSLLYNP